MKIDFEQLEKDNEDNFKERLEFIKYWVEFIKKNKDEVWSRQQNIVVDGQIF